MRCRWCIAVRRARRTVGGAHVVCHVVPRSAGAGLRRFRASRSPTAWTVHPRQFSARGHRLPASSKASTRRDNRHRFDDRRHPTTTTGFGEQVGQRPPGSSRCGSVGRSQYEHGTAPDRSTSATAAPERGAYTSSVARRCNACLRTGVTDVSGLNTPEEGGVNRNTVTSAILGALLLRSCYGVMPVTVCRGGGTPSSSSASSFSVSGSPR